MLKLYRNNRDNPLFPNNPNHEILALNHLKGSGLAPELIGAGDFKGGTWILYTYKDGKCWADDAVRAAELLGQLHKLPVPNWLPFKSSGSESIAYETMAILSKCEPRLRVVLSALKPSEIVPATERQCILHGDPVPGNIICDQHQMVLIDWQCPTRGDPCEDLGIFLSPAMQSLYRGSALTPAEEQAFLSSYPDTEIVERAIKLRPWFTWRMAAYCLWQTESGNTDYKVGMELELAALRKR